MYEDYPEIIMVVSYHQVCHSQKCILLRDNPRIISGLSQQKIKMGEDEDYISLADDKQ